MKIIKEISRFEILIITTARIIYQNQYYTENIDIYKMINLLVEWKI